MDQITHLRHQLREAVTLCSERCLYQSAKWAAELLNSVSSQGNADGDDDADSDTEPDSPTQFESQGFPSQSTGPEAIIERQLQRREQSKFLLAKTYFDCREFDRCAAVFISDTLLKGPTTISTTKIDRQGQAKGKSKAATAAKIARGNLLVRPSISQRALFLALYAKYLAGERRKDEESEMILGPADGGVSVNKELPMILSLLRDWFAQRHTAEQQGDGWLEYLYGIVLARSRDEEQAKEWLLRSVRLYPFNWSAWQELSGLVASVEELTQIARTQLPEHIMSYMFHVYTSQELYQTTDTTHNTITQLESVFGNSAFLKAQRALLFYHSRDFDAAERIFSTLLISDPYRIDHADNYSNILYVMNSRSKLAFLAQLVTSTDRYRPETCCVVGNYFSLKSEHEKAVMYFRRALTLDRHFLSAWTLMGHEYVEMKNTHAAIESYRRATDANRKDYRAWYGLGQTYEILDMHSYALFYYQRASALRPFDPKMWLAVGSCYDRIGRLDAALRSYKRALVASSGGGSASSSFDSAATASAADAAHRRAGGSLDPDILLHIALLYERANNRSEAAAYMELTLAQEEGTNVGAGGTAPDASGATRSSGTGVTASTSKARMWLARFAFTHSQFQRAAQLAQELCEDGVDVEEAKALLRDVRARVEGDDVDVEGAGG